MIAITTSSSDQSKTCVDISVGRVYIEAEALFVERRAGVRLKFLFHGFSWIH